VTNGVQELPGNAIDAQRNIHIDLKKKDCKTLYSIQAAIDILVKYYEGGEKVK
jgi:hypothetical protein